ncbi:MAG: hypothetical protein V1660_02300 [archaeon]
MKKEYNNIEALLRENVHEQEEPKTARIINELTDARKRGYVTKKEFVRICMWKSPRPKQLYISNSPKKVARISGRVFASRDEQERIDLLTELRGCQYQWLQQYLH